MQQTTDTLLLVRPFSFRKNEQTAVNNYFQSDLPSDTANADAQAEFDGFVNELQAAKINTIILQDSGQWDTPDSIFPNNCLSTHQGIVVLYPMFAENRRLERNIDYVGHLQKRGYKIKEVVDYTPEESAHLFLEGTGCLILDRINKIAYCSLSERAHEEVISRFCKDFNYQPCIFEAKQSVAGERKAIYHTNVMLSVGQHFAIVCLDSIDDVAQREKVLTQLHHNKKAIITISEAQMHAFAANILEVKSTEGNPYIIMSSTAYHSFDNSQREALAQFSKLIHAPLNTIETGGGGSARCMVAEIF